MQLNSGNCLQNSWSKGKKEDNYKRHYFLKLQLLPLGLAFLFMQKIEKILLWCLRIICNDYSSGYQTLLNLSEKPSVEIKRLRALVLEVLKP